MFLIHSGWTPLHLAARAGNADIVRMLLSCNGIDADARTDKVFLFFHNEAIWEVARQAEQHHICELFASYM